jgi:hypothetical protein
MPFLAVGKVLQIAAAVKAVIIQRTWRYNI